jgi:hypothetical protein
MASLCQRFMTTSYVHERLVALEQRLSRATPREMLRVAGVEHGEQRGGVHEHAHRENASPR